jgi:hypothetical protein
MVPWEKLFLLYGKVHHDVRNVRTKDDANAKTVTTIYIAPAVLGTRMGVICNIASDIRRSANNIAKNVSGMTGRNKKMTAVDGTA